MEKRSFARALWSAVLAAELLLPVDVIFAMTGKSMPILCMGAAAAILFLAFFLVRKFRTKGEAVAAVCIPCIIAILLGGWWLLWKCLASRSQYELPADDKAELFSGQNIMIIVPHQDDDFNMLGGAVDEFARYGSTVCVVFATTGDYAGMEDIRGREAIAYLSSCGVPEENVIFLGYGNEWAGDTHLYNASGDRILTSSSGKTKTVGIPGHPAFHDGADYTRNNMLQDIGDVILAYRPDVIFCSDYDDHIDHRALSLLFDEAMGNILKNEPDYSPTVFKGFAYYTSYLSFADFYDGNGNILSTQDPSGSVYPCYINVYRWPERVRIPVSASLLSESLYHSGMYAQTKYYDSQDLTERAERVINGDRLFWERNTSSLMYTTDISASSGNASLLNNFKLWDSENLADIRHFPFDGTWIPDPDDEEKSISVSFPQPEDLTEIVLYDSPSVFDNVLRAEIRFPNGDSIEVNLPDIGGSPCSVPVDEKNCSGFEIRILESEGECAGFCEIEAYAEKKNSGLAWVKIINSSDDFVYDYKIHPSGEELFSLYAYGCSADPEDYSVAAEGCHAGIEDGQIRVAVPKGKRGTVTVTEKSSGISDTVFVSNPVLFRNMVQTTEKLVSNFRECRNNTAFWRFLHEIKDFVT